MTHDANDHIDHGPRAPDPSPPDEQVLREAFTALREREASRAPAFERVLRGPAAREAGATRRATGWHVPALALGAVAFVAVALATWRGRSTSSPSATAEAPASAPTLAFVPGSMRVPTDYFLDLAAASTVDDVPSIGDIDWYPLLPADDGGAPDSARLQAPTTHDSMTHGVPNTRRRN